MTEIRYTPDEFFDLYIEFLKDPNIQARLKNQGIRTWEHEELLVRFLAYVKNEEFIFIKREAEFRKWSSRYPGNSLDALLKRSKGIGRTWPKDNAFGEPTDGSLFQPD